MSIETPMQAKVLYVINRAPYSNAVGQEALDAALIGASLDMDVSILFIQDGVFQLKRGQDSSSSWLKQYTKSYKALDDFGVEKLYVHDLSLDARGLAIADLMCAPAVVNSQEVKSLIADQLKVFTF